MQDEVKVARSAPEGPARISLTPEDPYTGKEYLVLAMPGTLAKRHLNVDPLHQTWVAWGQLETALKQFDPPVTAAEWAVLAGLATTTAAQNGLNELRQALTRAGRLAAGA